MFKISGNIIDVVDVSSKDVKNEDGSTYSVEKHQELYLYSDKKLIKIKNKSSVEYGVGEDLVDVPCVISCYNFNGKSGLSISIN